MNVVEIANIINTRIYRKGGYVCNKDSEYIADWTDYTDCCEEWESR